MHRVHATAIWKSKNRKLQCLAVGKYLLNSRTEWKASAGRSRYFLRWKVCLPLHRGGNHTTLTYTHQTLCLNEWGFTVQKRTSGKLRECSNCSSTGLLLIWRIVKKKVNYDLYNEEIHKVEQKVNTAKKLERTGKTSIPQARKTWAKWGLVTSLCHTHAKPKVQFPMITKQHTYKQADKQKTTPQ